MADRTTIHQDRQVRPSDEYDDTLPSGSTLETDALSLQDDANALRSQIKRILGEPNWYDDPAIDLATIAAGGGGGPGPGLPIDQTDVKKSVDYDDTLPSGDATLEVASTDTEYDLNGLRSQINRIIGDNDWWREAPITLRAVAAYLGGFRKDQLVTPDPNGSIRTFFTPEEFIYSTLPAESFLNPSVYLNGYRMSFPDDYIVTESGGVGTGFDSVEFTVGNAPRTGDVITVDYFISTGTIPPPAGGVGFYDESILVSVRPALNFIGSIVEATENIAADRVDVTFVVTEADVIPTPTFNSHWDSSDGNNGDQSVVDPLARTVARISSPSGGEGAPFNTNGWDGTNQSATLATSGTYTTPGTTTGFGGDSTMTVSVFDADGSVLETYTTPAITANAVHTSPSTNVVVTITGFGDDPSPASPILTKKSANASVFVDHDQVLTDAALEGGRFHVEITHTSDSVTDGGGSYTFVQSDVFLDKNPNTPFISGAVSISERAGSVLTKHLSGLEYYVLGSEFNASVLDIDRLNRNTQRTSSMLQVSGSEYGLSTLNQEAFPGGSGQANFSGWTNNHDQDNVDWSFIGWAITSSSYRFIGATANISAQPRDPWNSGSSVVSANSSILIDTYVNNATDVFESFRSESRRESIDGIGAGASGGSFPGAGLWSSTTNLMAGQAMVHNDQAMHPDAASFVDWSSFEPSLGGANPNYTALAGQAYVDYGRRFTKASGVNIPSFSMIFAGAFAGGNMLSDLNSGNVEMYVYRIAIPSGTSGNFGPPPGNTTPLRMHESFNFASYDDGATVPGSGIREGSSSGNTINCTFGTGTPADTGFYWHLRILNSLTRVDSVTVTFF